MEGAALVFVLTPLAQIVPVDLLIANVAESSAQPGCAGLGRPVAHAAIPVEADVDESRLLLGGGLRELVRRLLLGQLGLRPGQKEGIPKTVHLARCDEGLLVPPAGRVLLCDVIAELCEDLRLLVQGSDVLAAVSRVDEEALQSGYAEVPRHHHHHGGPHGSQGQLELREIREVVALCLRVAARPRGGLSGGDVVDVEEAYGELC